MSTKCLCRCVLPEHLSILSTKASCQSEGKLRAFSANDIADSVYLYFLLLNYLQTIELGGKKGPCH